MNKKEYACFKRCLDWYAVVPQFRKDMEASPKRAINALGVCDILDAPLVFEAIIAILYARHTPQTIAQNCYLKEYFALYEGAAASVQERHKREQFASDKLYRFSDTTRNRCRMESMIVRMHDNIRYFPLCFELGSGCRVQCDFCGLDAKPFEGNFTYTDENRLLWREILQASKAVIGDIVSSSICYFATEPLDNPDFERFMLDMKEITGDFPQITTALADQYPERIKTLMKMFGEDGLKIKSQLRISIRNIRQFHCITDLYTPEELAYVEVLANNPESVYCYADCGRAAQKKCDGKKLQPYALCCLAGVKVNMREKTLTFIEPMLPNEEFPLGYLIREECTFFDLESYVTTLRNLMEQYAVGTLPEDRPLCLNKHTELFEKDGFLLFVGDQYQYTLRTDYALKCILCNIGRGLSFQAAWKETGLDANRMEILRTQLNELYIRGFIQLK